VRPVRQVLGRTSLSGGEHSQVGEGGAGQERDLMQGSVARASNTAGSSHRASALARRLAFYMHQGKWCSNPSAHQHQLPLSTRACVPPCRSSSAADTTAALVPAHHVLNWLPDRSLPPCPTAPVTRVHEPPVRTPRAHLAARPPPAPLPPLNKPPVVVHADGAVIQHRAIQVAHSGGGLSPAVAVACGSR